MTTNLSTRQFLAQVQLVIGSYGLAVTVTLKSLVRFPPKLPHGIHHNIDLKPNVFTSSLLSLYSVSLPALSTILLGQTKWMKCQLTLKNIFIIFNVLFSVLLCLDKQTVFISLLSSASSDHSWTRHKIKHANWAHFWNKHITAVITTLVIG